MKILHLSNTPLSNSPSNLAKIQRDAGHEASALIHRQSNLNKVFVGGELWGSKTPEFLQAEFEDADIIHLHNFAWTQEIFKAHPQLIAVAKEKPCLIQYHSPRFNTVESFEDSVNDPFFRGRRAVIAQYHTRIYPEAEHIVPNVLPIFDNKYTPLEGRDWFSPVVSFAASNTHLQGWDYKGADKMKNVFRGIEYGRKATTDLITNTPYDECLLKKKWSTIGLEEIMTGSYHLSFLEYMSLGCATFCNMDALTREALAKIVGEEGMRDMPAIQTTYATVSDQLNKLIHEPRHTQMIGSSCRRWMERYWNPTQFVRYFEEIYAQL